MKNINKAFSLVELLVVITILAIISVVAYQNFGGAVNKAISGRKISDVATIETSLQQYKVDKNFYPAVGEYDAVSNMWGYNDSETANPSNTLTVNKTGQEIDSINIANGGGRIYGLNENGVDWSTKQIGAKGTISQDTLGRSFLTKDLYDPELGDVKVGPSGKMIDSGIGRYVYSVYRKPLIADLDWVDNKQGTYFNIAYTVLKDGTDTYMTKIVGDYDNGSCFENIDNCPKTLIGSGTDILEDGQENSDSDTSVENQGIPYPANNY